MKKSIIKIIGLLAFSVMVSSCDTDQDVASVVDIAKPAMTITFPTAVTANEGDLVPFTLDLSAPVGQDFDVYIVMQQNGSTANELDTDVSAATVNTTFQKRVTVPAFSTSFSGVIKIATDDLVEGDETLIISLGDTRTSAVSFVPVISTITIKNVVSDVLNLVFNYDATFTSSGTEYTLCDIGYDMDFYVLDAAMNDTGNYGAATGDCPEDLDLDLTDLADGTYYIFYDIYDDAGLSAAPHTPFVIPITVDYIRSGGIEAGTFAQESEFAPNSTDGSGSDYVVTIEVANGIFTLKNSVPEVIASGRAANKVQTAIEHARKNRKR